MKKVVFCVASLSCIGGAFGINYEYPYLYKDPRVMGMGGAYVAVGGSASALFYNPAGIGKIKKEAGFEVDLIGLSISVSEDGFSFVRDLMNALDVGDRDGDGDETDDQLVEVNKVIKAYRGKTLHFYFDSFPSISRRLDRLGFAVGGFVRWKFDAVPHQGFGSEGLVSVDTDFTYGLVGGISYSFLSDTLTVGVGIKRLSRERVVKDFTAREIIENQDNIEDYISDEVKDGSAIAPDIGVIYDLPEVVGFKPSVGASYLNIGDLDFDEAGKVPGTLNVGFAFKKERNSTFLKELVFALDIADITKNYEEDGDIGKRLRVGMGLTVWSGRWSDFILRVGSYQGYWTGGIEFRLGIARIVATSYAEEVGAYSGQDENRRYMLSAYVTW